MPLVSISDWLDFLAAISRRAFASEWSGGRCGARFSSFVAPRAFQRLTNIRKKRCDLPCVDTISAYRIGMNTNQVIEAAKAALTSGKTIYTDYTITVGGGSKCYKNETSSSASPEVQASNIIDAAMDAIFAVYQKGGEYDDVASDALEAFAREAGFAYLCSSFKA